MVFEVKPTVKPRLIQKFRYCLAKIVHLPTAFKETAIINFEIKILFPRIEPTIIMNWSVRLSRHMTHGTNMIPLVLSFTPKYYMRSISFSPRPRFLAEILLNNTAHRDDDTLM